MKPCSFIHRFIALALLVMGCLPAAHASNKFKYCPDAMEHVRVSTGDRVRIPFCAGRSKSAIVIGYANLAAINALLAKQDLFAVPVRGKAVIFIMAVQYLRSTLGPYQEVMVDVMASPRSDLEGGIFRFLEFSGMNPFAPPRTHGEAVLKIWVDTEIARAAGNEIWGLNKELAGISFHGDRGFSLSDSLGREVLDTRWADAPDVRMPGGSNLDLFAISHSGTWTRVRSEGTAILGKFERSDTLSFGSSAWGQILSSLEIQPSLKILVPNFRGQIFAPCPDCERFGSAETAGH